MGRHKPNKPRRTPGVGHVLVVFDHDEDAVPLAARLMASGCPHCGARAELRPAAAGIHVSITHRPDCPELADPGRLAGG